jgi:AraC family transcriptional regulator of adaptative response / DNA-3-methyladenine glycosylase II
MSRGMDEILGLDARALDRARISRDPRFDGRFFIAVTSTGIYCRPVCPVRSPKRTNIRYYPTAAAAAGYRPCLRCRPEVAPGTPAWLGTSAVVRRALRLIDEGILDRGSVEDLATCLGIGGRHLHRLFKKHVGASPIDLAQTRRLHFAKRLLDETKLPITEVAMAAGFGSLRRFNSLFQQTYGRAPREMRKHFDGRISQTANEVILKLAYRPPYDWSQVQTFLAARSIRGIERVDERGYARTVAAGDSHAIICVRHAPDERALELRVLGAAPGALFQIASTARRVFDLAADPERIGLIFRSDRLLRMLVQRRPGLRIPGAWNVFECAVRAILGQQVSVAAAHTLAARLVSRCGRQITGSDDTLARLFPTPADLASADLDGLGLTKKRICALRALARAVASGEISFDAPVEGVLTRLCALPGIGAWTAQYVSLRALNEPDAFPSADLVLRRSVAGMGAPLSAHALEARAEAWRPWRGYAAMHLWCAAKDLACSGT